MADTMGQLAASTVPVSSFRSAGQKTSKFINTQDIKHICNFYKSPELPLSLISDTFFLLANRSIDPNLREIAASYIVHYDYKEVLH